jgi:predicted acylesterase/phospholipase RssA
MTEADEQPETRRLLSIDGDGTRIYLSLRILRRIETELRRHTGDAGLTLGAWFDYVAGTNSGGLVAALIATGYPMAEIERRLKVSAPVIFRRRGLAAWLLANGPAALVASRRPASTVRADDTEKLLRQWFAGNDGPMTMGDVHDVTECHLLLGLHNLTTDSRWPMSSNPDATFSRDPVGSNLDLPLWGLVRATLAAPRRFEPVRLPLMGRTATANDFADGASGGMTNMALQLAMMATLPSYRLEWASGADRLLLVSVGSGLAEHVPTADRRRRRRPVPAYLRRREEHTSTLSHASVREDLLCRVLGDVRWAAPTVDLELAGVNLEYAGTNRPLFSYVRYNDSLSDKALRRLGVGHGYGKDLRRRDRLPRVDELGEVGDGIAAQVDLEHLGGF